MIFENYRYSKMQIIEKHIISNLKASTRLSDYARGIFPQIPTKAGIKKAIKRGQLLLNSEKAFTGDWVKVGDVIELTGNPEHIFRKTYKLKVPIVFEDEFLAVVHKPAGLVVSGNQFKTLLNTLSYNLSSSPQSDSLDYPTPVHRLDAQTSGLVLIAKTKIVQLKLYEYFHQREIKKEYHAVVSGKTKMKGTFDWPIEGKKSVTHYQLEQHVKSLNNEHLSLLKLILQTGRTHQIRKHLAMNKTPIIGDKLYNKTNHKIMHKGLFLAATHLEFIHPISQQCFSFKIDIPNKFLSLLKREEKRWIKYNPR